MVLGELVKMYPCRTHLKTFRIHASISEQRKDSTHGVSVGQIVDRENDTTYNRQNKRFNIKLEKSILVIEEKSTLSL